MMHNSFFQSIENHPDQTQVYLDSLLANLAFNKDGLIPVITQDATSKDVLMLAWMNKSAIKQTLETRRMTYWSRSRQNFWIKGETSGHTQELVSMSVDCDGDAILCFVNQLGAACHTGRNSCFYLKIDNDQQQAIIQGDSN